MIVFNLAKLKHACYISPISSFYIKTRAMNLRDEINAFNKLKKLISIERDSKEDSLVLNKSIKVMSFMCLMENSITNRKALTNEKVEPMKKWWRKN